MSGDTKPGLTEAEKDSLAVGWCGPCEQGTLDVEECRCAQLLWPAVERIKADAYAAARREALEEARSRVAFIRTPLNNLVGLSRAQAFHVGVGEVATLLDNLLLAGDPERPDAGGAR